MSRLLKLIFIGLFFSWAVYLSLSSVSAQTTSPTQGVVLNQHSIPFVTPKPHPLRPFPALSTADLVSEEKNRSINDPNLTPYCALRPTVVEVSPIDVRQQQIALKINGTLTQDFSYFITPLLSITETSKPDYLLPFSNKAQRYLLDYLEGRAYYEPITEIHQPDYQQQQEIFSRTGVFRKLAPKIYQDQLKKALIQRANNQFNSQNNPYGFEPATNSVHNYKVAYWDPNTNQPAEYKTKTQVTLKDYLNNWAPLPEDYSTPDEYSAAYANWQRKDNGKWFTLWPYVPMFTREDTKGFIEILDDPNQSTNPSQLEIIHPHLARAYEITNSLSYLLAPESTRTTDTTVLEEQWYTPAPWTIESPQWIKPAIEIPSPESNLNYGYVCDYTEDTPLISSSGDLAIDSQANTTVHYQTQFMPNPYYNPAKTTDICGNHFTCEQCIFDPSTGLPSLDDANCFVGQKLYYNPNYLITRTPFLDSIVTSLIGSPRSVFDILNPANTTQPQYGLDWPGIGNLLEESPVYTFTSTDTPNAYAEAGYHKPNTFQSFLYRYLGTIQCSKEHLLAALQPFVDGQAYQPFSPDCGFDTAPPTTPTSPGVCDGQIFAQLGPPDQTTTQAHQYFQSYIAPRLTPELIDIYAQAQAATDVPCEVLAGIHFVEGGNNMNQSLISGRPIGTPEPDQGGKIYNSLLETAIDAGNILKAKVGGSIGTLHQLITALSRYNGGGNSNCRPSYTCSYAATATTTNCPTDACCNSACRDTCAALYNTDRYHFVYSIPSVSFCPPVVEGWDDHYPMNYYDQAHLTMYNLYCQDLTMCTPRLWTNPGSLTVAVEFYLSNTAN